MLFNVRNVYINIQHICTGIYNKILGAVIHGVLLNIVKTCESVKGYIVTYNLTNVISALKYQAVAMATCARSTDALCSHFIAVKADITFLSSIS